MLTTRHGGEIPAPGSTRSRGAGQLAAFLLASCTASGAITYKPLPAIVWEGERLRFATTVGRLPCGDSLEYMDRRVDELTAVLDHPMKPGEKITYYWLPGRMDLSPCPESSDCADGLAVFSRTLFHDHEIVHVLLRDLGRSQTFLYEGMAEAFGRAGGAFTVERTAVRSEILRSLSANADPKTISYPLAGLFVRFLVQRHGMTAVKRVYARARHDTDTSQLREIFHTELGVSLDETLDLLAETAPDCYPRQNLCTARPVAWSDGAWNYRFGLSCASPGVLEIVPGALRNEALVEIPQAGAYRLIVSRPSVPVKELVVARCGCRPDLHTIESGSEATLELDRGRYRVLVGRRADDSSAEVEPVSVTIRAASARSP
jgi:hypothetical protein